ncbi:MAG: hypothetical protein HQM12_16800 [SAR324 cluster bacterium]|nr:hypothetical protein [SAR324 cluster bacterium]
MIEFFKFRGVITHINQLFSKFKSKDHLIIALMICSIWMSYRLTSEPVRDGDIFRHKVVGAAILENKTFAVNDVINSQLFPLMNLWTVAINRMIPGDTTLNRTAFLVYLLSILLFSKILSFYNKSEGAEHNHLWTLSLLACHPIVVNSGSTYGDYIYSLFLILVSWYLVLHRFPGLAGLFIAIASGMRITNAIWVIPFFILFCNNKNYRHATSFVVTAIIGGYLVWLGTFIANGTLNPLVVFDWSKGLATTNFNPTITKGLQVMINRTTHFIGISVILYCLIFFKHIDLDKWIARIKQQQELLAAVVVVLIVFTILGDKQEYMITLAPVFALLLPSFKRKSLNRGLCVVVFSMNIVFINFLNSHPTKIYISNGYWSQSMAVSACGDWLKLKFNIPNGEFAPIDGDANFVCRQ